MNQIMSSHLKFYLLPFNPRLAPEAKIQLPINLDDFAHQMQNQYPTGEININKTEG
jgi:hypothetical protein